MKMQNVIAKLIFQWELCVMLGQDSATAKRELSVHAVISALRDISEYQLLVVDVSYY